MAYCEHCKGEHKPKRKIPASRLVMAWYAARYFYEVGAPGFAEAFRQLVPGDQDSADEDLHAWLGDSVQCLKDLLSVFRDPETSLLRVSATEFLVLRDTALGDATKPVMAVSDDPPGVISIGIAGEDNSMTCAAWGVTRASAQDVIAALRERLGEPDVDSLASPEDAGTCRKHSRSTPSTPTRTDRNALREPATWQLVAALRGRLPRRGQQARRPGVPVRRTGQGRGLHGRQRDSGADHGRVPRVRQQQQGRALVHRVPEALVRVVADLP